MPQPTPALAVILVLAVAGCGALPAAEDEVVAPDPLVARAAALDAAIDDPGVRVAVEAGQLVLVLPEASVFSRGESIWLLEEGEETLGLAAATLKDVGGEVLVVGHTDDTGTDAYAQDLSERQAQAVAEALSAGGVPARRIRSYGLGDQVPLVPNDSPRNRSRNRRVEVVASPAG